MSGGAVSRQGQELRFRGCKQKAQPNPKPLSGQRKSSESEAARKKPEVNLVQTTGQGKEWVAGCLGSGWVSDDPSNKVRRSPECGPGSPEERAHISPLW